MDRRFHNSTPRGRGQSWRPKATTAKHCHNHADGATADSPCEISNGSKDTVSSNENRTSQPMSFGKKLNQFGHGKVPKYQYRQVHNSPISSGGDNINLVNDTNRVTEPVAPTMETCLFVSVSHSKTDDTSSNSRDKNVVDDGEKSGDSLLLGHLSTGSSAHRHDLATGANSISEISSGNKDDPSSYGNKTTKERSEGNSSKQFNHVKTFEPQYRKFRNYSDAKEILTGVEKLNLIHEVVTPSPDASFSSNLSDKNLGTSTSRYAQMVDNDAKSEKKSHMYTGESTSTPFSNSGLRDKNLKDNNENSDNLNCQFSGVPYDICPPRYKAVITLNPSLHKQNRMKRDEAKRAMEGQKIIKLRCGMILLKHYISFNDQVKIIEECRDLGKGPGGFYEPGYRDGGKLHLKMMCLGKNWDPQKREYGEKREMDNTKPPLIPNEFHQMVKGAIEASHLFLRKSSKTIDLGRALPSMSPNICLVNFYTKSGRLGLHQDKDESKESIERGLPVVSFSIGDSAEFLYGDQADPEKANKVVLESGDVLIFGGKSRLVFHGVTSILAETAPNALLQETGLRPGRLNLTFRES